MLVCGLFICTMWNHWSLSTATAHVLLCQSKYDSVPLSLSKDLTQEFSGWWTFITCRLPELLLTFISLQAKFEVKCSVLPVSGVGLPENRLCWHLLRALFPLSLTRLLSEHRKYSVSCPVPNSPSPSLPLSLSLSLVYLFGNFARYFPRKTVCTHNAPTPWRTPHLPLHSHPPTLPWVLLSNHLPWELVHFPANRITEHIFKYCSAWREDITTFAVRSSIFHLWTLHLVHNQLLLLLLLHIHAYERWIFDRSPQSLCQQSTTGWQHHQFYCCHTGCKNLFLLLLLSNPGCHVLPVKQLWILQMSLTPFCLCFHSFSHAHKSRSQNTVWIVKAQLQSNYNPSEQRYNWNSYQCRDKAGMFLQTEWMRNLPCLSCTASAESISS